MNVTGAMVLWPKHWPKSEHDVIKGPCMCGQLHVHPEIEFADQINRYGLPKDPVPDTLFPPPDVHDYALKDSGEKAAYSTGAQRDTRAGKGRFDLLSPIALRRLAAVAEKGAEKYDARNWEKGIPMSRLLDSAKRHLNQYQEGHRDEDHLAQAMWNCMAAIHTKEMIDRRQLPKELDDLPSYLVDDET